VKDFNKDALPTEASHNEVMKELLAIHPYESLYPTLLIVYCILCILSTYICTNRAFPHIGKHINSVNANKTGDFKNHQ